MFDAKTDDYPSRLPQERWLERHDPVVWQEWNEHAPLTRAQAQSFDRDGFLVLHDLFSPAEVVSL
ncbi:hypothetical protein SAMN06265221_1491, partial [Paracoccus laeviglucosivorans]